MDNFSSNATGLGTETGLPEVLRMTLITLGILYTVIGLPGNVLTIAAIVKVKPLRSRLNMFIVNLCVTDIIAVGYLYPFATLDLILGYPPVPLLWCQLNLLVFNLIVPAAFLTILLIAISRYTKILHEVKFEKYFTKTKTIIYCWMTWLPGFSLALFNISKLPTVYYQRRSRMCFVRREVFSLAKWLGSPLVLLSCILVVFCYVRIIRTMNAYALTIRSHGNEAFSKIRLDSNRRLTSMSFLIFMFYICMTMPLYITFNANFQSIGNVHIIVISLYFANSFVNCIVYGAMHKPIRRYYKKLLPDVWFIRVQPAPIRR